MIFMREFTVLFAFGVVDGFESSASAVGYMYRMEYYTI